MLFIKVFEIFDNDDKESLYISNNSNPKMDKVILKILFLLSVIVLIGNYLDAITTYFALQKDKNHETNNAMDYAIENFGWVSFFVIKFVLVSWFLLPLKYCVMYIPVTYLKKNINFQIKIFIIAVIAIAYLYLGYNFWAVSINNLGFIL